MASAANSAGRGGVKHPRNAQKSTAVCTSAAVAILQTVLIVQPSTVMTTPMRMRAVPRVTIRGVSKVEILAITPVNASAPCAVVQKSVGVGGTKRSHTLPSGRMHVDLTVPLRKKLKSTNR